MFPPTTVPTPIAVFDTNNPTNEANKTGKDKPVPINIAPAMSSGILYRLQNTVIAGTQYSSQINAIAQNTSITPAIKSK
jgi:hypothetical protein